MTSAVRDARGGTLVVGGGFAGAYVARLLGGSPLRRRPSRLLRSLGASVETYGTGATIVSPENFMLFTPMLPEAASGTLEPRHVVVPLRVMCPHAELLLGSATALDEQAKTVDIDTGAGRQTVRWQRLVLALGAIPRTLPIPGLAEHALGFKSLADAIALRNHVLGRLEAAAAETDREAAERKLGFVFVGAGYAGVEALAELADLVRDALRVYPGLRQVRQRWVLVDMAPKILAEIPSRLGDYAARELEGRGVEIHVGTKLESVEEGAATLSDGTRVPAETVVWTAGVRPNPLLAEWELPVDDRGRVRCDELLHVEGREDVWALGDCARVPNRASDHPDPPTSQHALRQARRLVKNMSGDPQPYAYRMLGQVATLGRYKGVAEVLGLRLRGFPAWLFTRTYHLYQLPLWQRKLRVVIDWTVSLAFRRDVAELGMVGHPERLD